MELIETAAGLRLVTATRGGGGMLALAVSGAGLTLVDQKAIAAGVTLSAPSRLGLLDVAGVPVVLLSGPDASRLGGYAIDAQGGFGDATQLVGTPGGRMAAHAVVTLGAERFLYLNEMGEGAIRAYGLQAGGSADFIASYDNHGTLQGVDVTDLVSVRVNGAVYLVSLSAATDAMRSYRVQNDGALREVASLGAAGGLGLAAPSALIAVAVDGVQYLLVAGAGSSSISVVDISDQGRLSLTDHVIDSLDTRFQAVQAMTSVRIGDRVLVFAGGADDGVTVFTLLPNGRLLLLDLQLRVPGLYLDNITAMTARVVNGAVDLFVAGDRAGIMRLQYDPGAMADVMRGGSGNDSMTGGGQGDLIFGVDGDDDLEGGAGDDILMDGVGSDTLTGGAGADIFVLSPDAATDVILDYQPGVDRIDLTGWGRVYDISALDYRARASGALLRFGDETLIIATANGQSLPESALRAAELFGLWHLVAEPVIEGLRMEGSGLADLLRGGAGDDTIVGSVGADTIEAGGGFDVMDYRAATGPLVVDLTTPGANRGLAAGDRHSGVEGIIGGGFDDVLRGTTAGNLIRGGAGGDALEGRGGADTLYGGDGDDLLTGGSGADRLVGGEGRDRADHATASRGLVLDLAYSLRNSGDAAADHYDSIEEFGGSNFGDTISGGRSGDRLFGNAGTDLIRGRAGSDYLDGGAGNDTLWGESGNDTFVGGSGWDRVEFWGPAPVRVDLRVTAAQTTGDGADSFTSIEAVTGGDGADWLRGHDGANALRGGAGADSLYGGGGVDSLYGGAGDDRISGGDGVDWLVFLGATRVTLDLALTGRQSTGWGRDTISTVENIRSGSGRDMLSGDGQMNRIEALAGDDMISGRGGDDTLLGGDGADTLYGGTGDDAIYGGNQRDRLVFYSNADIRVHLGLTGYQTTGQGRDQIRGVQDISTYAGDDQLTGNDDANRFSAGAGRDLLLGRAGADTLYGGDDADTLRGGSDGDALYGGDGRDWGDYSGDVAVRVDLANTGWQRSGHGTDRLSGIENLRGGDLADRLYGNGGSNAVLGDRGADVLVGRDGHDTLRGGSGNDVLYGGNGNDVLDGGDGRDLLILTSTGAQVVDLAISRAQSTGQGRDAISGVENLQTGRGADRAYGNSAANWMRAGAGNDLMVGRGGNDTLSGGDGADTLYGSTGDDRLYGGGGWDKMTGGSGADEFVFAAGHDAIRDFSAREGDRVVLDKGDLAMIRGLSDAQIVARYGHDHGTYTALEFSKWQVLMIEDVSTLHRLSQWIDVI